MPLPHKNQRREFFRKRDEAAVDAAMAKKRAEIRKSRAAALKKKPKPKPKSWYERVNPFKKLTPILGNKKEKE